MAVRGDPSDSAIQVVITAQASSIESRGPQNIGAIRSCAAPTCAWRSASARREQHTHREDYRMRFVHDDPAFPRESANLNCAIADHRGHRSSRLAGGA